MKTCPTCFQDIARAPRHMGGIVLDPDRHTLANGSVVHHLSPTATEILHHLMRHPSHIISVETLGGVFDGDSDWIKALRVTISRLRKIIVPLRIECSVGTGYYLVDPEAAVVKALKTTWTNERDLRGSSS